MSDEQLREEAVKSAIDELADALLAGDREEVEATFSQIQQIGKGIDLTEWRERIDVPKDAGEWADGLTMIMKRIPDGWGRWIRCSKGWYPLLVALDQDLAAIDPGYEVHQAKEKYGSLRYYCHSNLVEQRERFNDLVRTAESLSAEICEICGAPGSLHLTQAPSPWYQTLCPEHAAMHGRITQEAWDAWWDEERPKYWARQRENFVRRMTEKRVLVVAESSLTDRLTFPATIVNDPDEAVALLSEPWQEVWIDGSAAGEAIVKALAEKYRDHYERQKKESAEHFERRRAGGHPTSSFLLKPPEGAPVLGKMRKVDTGPLSSYGIRVVIEDSRLFLKGESDGSTDV